MNTLMILPPPFVIISTPYMMVSRVRASSRKGLGMTSKQVLVRMLNLKASTGCVTFSEDVDNLPAFVVY